MQLSCDTGRLKRLLGKGTVVLVAGGLGIVPLRPEQASRSGLTVAFLDRRGFDRGGFALGAQVEVTGGSPELFALYDHAPAKVLWLDAERMGLRLARPLELTDAELRDAFASCLK